MTNLQLIHKLRRFRGKIMVTVQGKFTTVLVQVKKGDIIKELTILGLDEEAEFDFDDSRDMGFLEN